MDRPGAATASGQLDYFVQVVDSAGNVAVPRTRPRTSRPCEEPDAGHSQGFGVTDLRYAAPAFTLHHHTAGRRGDGHPHLHQGRYRYRNLHLADLEAQAYTLDGTSCSGLSTTANYSLTYAGNTGGFVVSKAPLGVTATSLTRTYGAANPTFTYP